MDKLLRKKVILIVNTLLCVIAVIPAIAVAGAAIMGGAAPGAGELGANIAIASFLLPVLPVVSILGSWVCYRWPKVAYSFVALPWVYGFGFAVAVALFLSQ